MMNRLLLIGLICFVACSKPSIPKDVLAPEKMQAVFWDYIKADAFANEFVRRDTSKKLELESAKLQLQVFKQHKISKEQFYKSYEFYLGNKDLMKNLMDTMLVRQKQETAIKPDSSGAITVDTTRKIFKTPRLLDTITKQAQ